jgi:BlaI family penicillinase repressor
LSHPKQAGKRRKSRYLGALGSLEVDVLTIVWEAEHCTVRDVYERLLLRRRIAYTSCMTVMEHLVRKGLLAVDRHAKAYLYSAALPGEQVAGRLLDDVVARLWHGDRGPALAYLLGLAQALSEQQIADLRRWAEERFGSD